MFGEHKGHNVSAMEEASKSLRTKMDEAARTGKSKILIMILEVF